MESVTGGNMYLTRLFNSVLGMAILLQAGCGGEPPAALAAPQPAPFRMALPLNKAVGKGVEHERAEWPAGPFHSPSLAFLLLSPSTAPSPRDTITEPLLVTELRRDGPELPRDAREAMEEVHSWFRQDMDADERDRLLESYYGFYQRYDPVDLQTFRRRVHSRLPRYRELIHQAAEANGLHWMLLAAVAYQESHWNPRARSPTGVRGMMMLTRVTAAELGVDNRLDPGQAIPAGARYLAGLRKRLPASVREPDRTWMALAAYNIGYGHLMDARQLCAELHQDPDSWDDLKEILPLLANKAYYRHLRYGYARGWEPVRYVRRVRDYLDELAELTGGDDSAPVAVALRTVSAP
jgi:soluble lytic murein transglycosylase-like protein